MKKTNDNGENKYLRDISGFNLSEQNRLKRKERRRRENKRLKKAKQFKKKQLRKTIQLYSIAISIITVFLICYLVLVGFIPTD